jgi:neopullulanase
VKTSFFFCRAFAWRRRLSIAVTLAALLSLRANPLLAQSELDSASPDAPAVTKVEPPSWWIKLTPELMVLVSGRNLEVSHAECNLRSVSVERTRSVSSRHYVFVWLRITPDAKSGTAVCRLTTPTGIVSFELPLAARTARLGRNQGITPADAIYLIVPDRFANGNPTNDEPADAPHTGDRANPRAYHGGDLRGIREHLPYLKDLGITALSLTPILRSGSAQDHHGYSAVDLYAVDPDLGTNQEYRDLVGDAHKQDLKIIFDFVANHVGPQHPWVVDPPTADWFHGPAQNHENTATGIPKNFYGDNPKNPIDHDPFEILADPHATSRLSRNLTDGWLINTFPDLNTENPLVGQYLLQNAIWWAEISGLDAYRLDAFPYVPRRFWAIWHSGLRQLYPYLTTIGEVSHPDPSVTSFFQGGQRRFDGLDSGLSTLFDYPAFFALRDVLLRQAPVGRITDILRHDSLYVDSDTLVTFFGNHDVERFVSAAGSSPAKLKLAFALTLTLRGIPELYYGDEIAMPGGADPDNRRDFPGGWPGDPKNAFTPEGRTSEQQEIFTLVQTLLRLRREHPSLQSGRLWHLSSDDASYVFLRETEDERVLVAFNNSAEPKTLRVPLNDTPAQGAPGLTLLFGEAQGEVASGAARLVMPAQSLSIFLLN